MTCAGPDAAPGWPPSASPAPHRSRRPGVISRSASGPGCTGACTSPTATPPGPPTRAAPSPAPRRWWSAPTTTAGTPPSRDVGTATARWRGTRGATTTPRCGRRSAWSPVTCGRRVAGAVVADDNALVDREAAYRAGLGWYGKNTNLLLDDRGSWFVLGSVVTDAPLPETGPPMEDGCGACTRCLTACPTGALVAPGRARRPPVPGLAAAGPGLVPARVPRGARRPGVRLRRLPGGVPAQPALRPARPAAAGGAGCRAMGVAGRDAVARRRHAAHDPVRAVVHPPPRAPLPPPQRAGRPRQRRRRRRPGGRRTRCGGAWPTPTRSCGGTRCGPPARLDRRDLLADAGRHRGRPDVRAELAAVGR